MKCPLCNTEMKITGRHLVYDDTPDKETKMQLDFSCRNKKCPNYGKEEPIASELNPVL